jgi:hypothetical protein
MLPQTPHFKRTKDLTGQRFGRLVVVSFAGTFERSKGNRAAKWNCVCDCGNATCVFASCLIHSGQKSCGCFQRDQASECNKVPPQVAAFNKLLLNYSGGAKRRGYRWELSTEEAKSLFLQQCHYCGRPPSQMSKAGKRKNSRRASDPFIYNGIDRLDNSVGYVPGNCVPCCSTCNYAKRDMSAAEFVTWIKRAASHLQKLEVDLVA